MKYIYLIKKKKNKKLCIENELKKNFSHYLYEEKIIFLFAFESKLYQ